MTGKLPALSHVEPGMSYRDLGAALRTRREVVARRLAEARSAAAHAWEHEARITGLEQDLAAIDALLEREVPPAPPGPRSLLDDVRIASPCSASWDDMIGDERVRFCQQCTKNVYNLSALSRQDAEALLRAGQEREATRGEGLCVRLYRRADGTVLTADCPDGARRKKRRLALFGAVGGGLMAAGAAAAELFGASHQTGALPPAPLMGDVATMGQARGSQPEVSPPPVSTAPAPFPNEGWFAGGLPPPKLPPPKVSHRPAPKPTASPYPTMGLLVTNTDGSR
jgi:hypothetical protein